MATAIVPILVALEPVIAPLIVKLLDKVLGNKTGPIKLATGVSWFKNLFGGIVKAGAASDKQIPDDATIQAWLQQIVDKLNKAGELNGKDTVIAAPPGENGPSADNAELILRLLVSISPALGVRL